MSVEGGHWLDMAPEAAGIVEELWELRRNPRMFVATVFVLSSLCGVGALVYPVLNDFAEGTPQAPGSARVDSTVRPSMVSVNFIKSCVPGPATLARRETWGFELRRGSVEFSAPDSAYSICR